MSKTNKEALIRPIASSRCRLGDDMKKASLSIIQETMAEFADRTGLSPGKAPQRYLWTDAFAVCNFLELYRQTGDDPYQQTALRLVDQVHNTLGRHRKDDSRTGWISGLNEQEGRRNPTMGGLRIGKEMNERRPGDPFDEDLEWDRDGQYYHYLTKWMHALNRVSRITGDAKYNQWAIGLAKTAHARFVYGPPSRGQKRMYWKMSIDLSHPLVQSMGQHDPLDGFITYSQLQATAGKDAGKSSVLDLRPEIADLSRICEGKDWTTDDPLGIGGLLSDACRVAQLIISHDFGQPHLLEILLDSSLLGLESYRRQNPLKLPAEYRLAFRELGLSIGLRGMEKLQGLIGNHPDIFDRRGSLDLQIEALRPYGALRNKIEIFWLERSNRETNSWMAHRNINMVMLATSLAPEGYLTL